MRSSSVETALGLQTVPGLRKDWVYTTGGNVPDTPTVDADAVYVTDWGGLVSKLDRASGKVLWKHHVSEYMGSSTAFSRNSPALGDTVAVIGSMGTGTTATVMAVNKATGALVWKTPVDTRRSSVITTSPIIFGNRVYVGVSSYQELTALAHPNLTLDFRGSVVALDLASGAIVWQFYTVPDGYTGGAVWGSTLVPDAQRGSLYVTTGNNYTLPAAVSTCIKNTPNPTLQQLNCLAPDDYIDAVLALDLQTGTVKWSQRFGRGSDAWNFTCELGQADPECPDPYGPDADFGSGVNVINTSIGGKPTELLGAGEKSGDYWAVNPDDGSVVWHTQVGPGGTDGGILWGSATDGTRVYCAITDLELKSYKLGPDFKVSHRGGSWAALDAATGAMIWQVPEQGMNPLLGLLPAASSAALTVANGVLYAGSQSGDMVALDAATGKSLWTFASGGTVMGGPSVVDGWVYWGSGYNNFIVTGKGNDKLYAFKLP
ncbi:MAG: PQQ-binding-like beta-propeller repeat protein [Nevskia sp.]|nr:PQQ-binding-like beta-propeller repeat protein [Nevskia sp.]